MQKACDGEISCGNGCGAGSRCGDRLEVELQTRTALLDAQRLTEVFGGIPRSGVAFFATWPVAASLAFVNEHRIGYLLAAFFLWSALLGLVVVKRSVGTMT